MCVWGGVRGCECERESTREDGVYVGVVCNLWQNQYSLSLSLSLWGCPNSLLGTSWGGGGGRGEKPINVGQRTLTQSLPPTGREVMCQFLEVVEEDGRFQGLQKK